MHGTSCVRCHGTRRSSIPNVGQGDLTCHCGKLLHEAAPVLQGRRYVVVGFVEVASKRVDVDFVTKSHVANTSTVGGWADHQCVSSALLSGEGQGHRGRPERGGDGDMACQLFGM